MVKMKLMDGGGHDPQIWLKEDTFLMIQIARSLDWASSFFKIENDLKRKDQIALTSELSEAADIKLLKKHHYLPHIKKRKKKTLKHYSNDTQNLKDPTECLYKRKKNISMTSHPC